jgi:multidrug efflux pump subunit AcrA (membrane-fusion protein)
MQRKLLGAAVAGSLVILAACSEKQEEKVEVVRPVLFVTAQAEPSQQMGFAGSVEPQYSTDLAFRVLGRLIQRNVDIGDMVEKVRSWRCLIPHNLI